MRFDVYTPSVTTATTDATKSTAVAKAASVYAARQSGPANTGQGSLQPHPGGAHQTHVSPMGQLLLDLHGLKNDDPSAFSKVTSTIAERLQQIAASEPEEVADRINRLAARFSQASQTGSLAAFRPQDQAPMRGARGPAAYAVQRQHDEDAQELRQEVRSAIRDVVSEFVEHTQPTPSHVPPSSIGALGENPASEIRNA